MYRAEFQLARASSTKQVQAIWGKTGWSPCSEIYVKKEKNFYRILVLTLFESFFKNLGFF